MLRRSVFLMIVAGSILSLLQAQPSDTDQIDWNKAKQLRQKMLKGEKLTEDEAIYLERAKKAIQEKNRPPSRPAKPPVGLKPLTDMSADEKYKGEDGGLYGSGRNEPPEKHGQAALEQNKLIRPLDAEGKPAQEGKVVLISVGMSNTTQEFSQFMRLANADTDKSPKVVIVDGAQGGMETQAWAERPNPWDVLERRLKQAGVTPEQVQVAWIKQARRSPASLGEFPKHAQEMKGHMVVILHKLKERFPNLRIGYLSSRIYAGYARTQLNPEPYAYESAFCVRWLIQDQIRGEPALNFDADKGAVKAPLLLWGPYLWADGEKGRKWDDLIWKPDDFAQDGTHPGRSGQQKVAELLLNFFKTDGTATGWFTKGG